MDEIKIKQKAFSNPELAAFCGQLSLILHSGISSLEFAVFLHIIFAFLLIKASPLSIKDNTLPEYSASSNASIVPPILFNPFHLVQKSLEHRIGFSSAIKAPALVR